MSFLKRTRLPLMLALLTGLLCTACGSGDLPIRSSETPPPAENTQITLPTITASATDTPVIPTPTPEPPLAARVNGERILLETFNQEFSRYTAAQQSLGQDLSNKESFYQTKVLDSMIEQLLIEQSASTVGISVSDSSVEVEVERLIVATGGELAFQDWLEMNQYTLDEFKTVLKSQLITQAMNAYISASVGETAEQVHARHIVVESREKADQIIAHLQSGTDFATLASEYSLDESTRLNGGDLGYFPHDLLLSVEVEEVAFSLGIGEISRVIESAFGYHIIQVLDRDQARPVPPEILQRMREAAFDRWVGQLWATAQVERTI